MSLALYRKYRPATFAELKGQEHVAEPLQQALRNGRINHAYLFSGPRGCGKTSSARILARSLNCEQGPTPEPCGKCDSCVALGPTGTGHIDVIEIDAASHGGVDDARDLRERAFFAPVSARFKVYIIDEAHMVTREGFNALLKLVEEPPPHLKFVFATTEPEKVIGTIRSRTHHYPFRLIPPGVLQDLVEEILRAEDVPFEESALPLAVRAGAGSARDTLSILDQLLAGSDEDGITYARAVSLLGYTDSTLLDGVVAAFAARDGAAVFEAVDRVVESGQDPRRFTADLLERVRDLVILSNVPEAGASGLLNAPSDEMEQMRRQAASMGPAELTRAADLLHTGLTEMRGATSPRLLLELICARILLPAAYEDESSMLARLDRLERQVSQGGGGFGGGAPGGFQSGPGGGGQSGQGGQSVQGGQEAAGARQAPVPPPAQPRAPVQASSQPPSQTAAPSQAAAPSPAAAPVRAEAPAEAAAPTRSPAQPAPTRSADPAPPPARQAPPARGGDSAPGAGAGPARGGSGGPGQGTTGGSGVDVAAVQRLWPDIVEAVKQRSRVAWMVIMSGVRPVTLDRNLLTLAFEAEGARTNFANGGRDVVLREVLKQHMGVDWRIDTVLAGAVSTGGRTGGGGPGGSGGRPGPSQGYGQSQSQGQGHGQGQGTGAGGSGQGYGSGTGSSSGASTSAGASAASSQGPWTVTPPEPPGSASSGGRRGTDDPGPLPPPPDEPPPPSEPSPVDEREEVDPEGDADADGNEAEMNGMALIQRELGGQVIREIDNS